MKIDYEKADMLLRYLRELQGMKNSGYVCNDEISECVANIRGELIREEEASTINGKKIEEYLYPVEIELSAKDGEFTAYELSGVPIKSLISELESRKTIDKYKVVSNDKASLHISRSYGDLTGGALRDIDGEATILIIEGDSDE